jgi:hypothetical protein
MSLLTDAGHDIEAIASALANTLSMSIDEVASTLHDFGHDVNTICNVLGSVFNAAPQEIVSGLTSAGITVEHAFESAFGDAGGVLSKDVNFVGNSIASLAVDGVDALANFVDGDVAKFLGNTLSDAGNFFEGVGDSIKNACEIM